MNVSMRGWRPIHGRLVRSCYIRGVGQRSDPAAQRSIRLVVADFGRAATIGIRAPICADVSQRTLAFVNQVADAGPPDPSTDVVVLDTRWTPGPDARPDLIPLLPVLRSVLRRVDLFDGSLDLLDAWAAAANLADRFLVDEITWWYRIRMVVRWDIHELMLWSHLLAELATPGRYDMVVVPEARPRLVDAARAFARAGGTRRVRTTATRTDRVHMLRESLLRRAGGRSRRGIRRALALARGLRRRIPRMVHRDAVLAARVEALRSAPGGVLAIASARFFQVIRAGGRDRLADPHLALVLDRLAGDGVPVTTLALVLDHRHDSGWATLERDDRLLPQSLLGHRWSRPEDDAIDSGAVAAGLVGIGAIPLEVAGSDLGPAFGRIVAAYAGTWLDGQRRGVRRAERLMQELRPSVLFVDHEGVRTLWLAAAHRLGIPIVAVQHGVIYRNNPEYVQPLHPGLVRADTTCVFGSFERDLLIAQGGYDPGAVLVTGSSRSDPDREVVPASPDERAEVRRELGVADGDRLLVVSVAHNPVAGDLHSAEMVARLLGGPLESVHLVFKLHPQDQTGGPFEALLRGLARSGGYPAPPITVVRDFDLYRLLRSADAHLGQYSTVLTDAVVAGTPNMIAVGLAYDDMLGYVAAGVAVAVRGVEDVRAFMLVPRATDPADRAGFLDLHFRRGDATGRIVAAIEAATVDRGPAPDAGTGRDGGGEATPEPGPSAVRGTLGR